MNKCPICEGSGFSIAFQTSCFMCEGTGEIEKEEEKEFNVLDQIMSCQEAAELWNLNPDYIRELCNKGKVKAKNIGKTWIIDKNQPSPKKY